MTLSTAQSPQPPSKAVVAARVDSMARAYMAEKAPASMSMAISRGSEMLVQRAWGVADITTGRPVTAASIYKIGSVSKQFTAVLLLKQVERGKLALTDSIGRYLTTGLRPEWRPLTIEQLLNHTAGLQNDLKREGRPEEEVSADTMIVWAARDTMSFAPGTRFAYSNVGYVLLGALVEKVYGKPYGAAGREEIARQLGLAGAADAAVRQAARGKLDSIASANLTRDPHYRRRRRHREGSGHPVPRAVRQLELRVRCPHAHGDRDDVVYAAIGRQREGRAPLLSPASWLVQRS